MSKKKKKDALREIHNPDGSVTIEYEDGSSSLIPAAASASNPIISVHDISAAQLSLWQRSPKEQALKEALVLFKAQGMDVSEQRIKLEIIKFISELQGALVPAPLQSQAIVVEINMGNGESLKYAPTAKAIVMENRDQ